MQCGFTLLFPSKATKSKNLKAMYVSARSKLWDNTVKASLIQILGPSTQKNFAVLSFFQFANLSTCAGLWTKSTKFMIFGNETKVQCRTPLSPLKWKQSPIGCLQPNTPLVIITGLSTKQLLPSSESEPSSAPQTAGRWRSHSHIPAAPRPWNGVEIAELYYPIGR